ncbi:MAG: hypothetical protein H0V44_00650 [Planctomycetes bacterium]|nr:hypothetical protein [Planctomycetota bacterium]
MTSFGPAGYAAGAALMIALIIAAGCAESRPSPQAQLYHPPAYHPEHFPDIPLFPLGGYVLTPGADQLAVSLAGGSVRRFEVSMQQRDGAKEDPPAAVLARYDSELTQLGWTSVGPSRWRKQGEDLIIEAGRSGGLTSIRFHLQPAPVAAAPAPGAVAPNS